MGHQMPQADQRAQNTDACGILTSLPAPATTAVQKKRLILGLGNELLTDDAIGFHIASALQHECATKPGTTVAVSSDVGLGLLDLICGYDEVVLIDAIQTGKAEVGFVHEMNSTQLKATPGIAPHFMGIAEMLALGRELGMPVPSQLRIFAVEVEDPYTLGIHLSPALRQSMPALVKRIRSRLN